MKLFTLPSEIQALFVTNPVNIYYLTGFSSLSAPLEKDAYLFITEKNWYLLTYAMYKSEAEQAVSDKQHITPIYLSQNTPLKAAFTSIKNNHQIESLGVESGSILLNEYRLLTTIFPSVSLQEKLFWIEPLRVMKTDTEVEYIKNACAITDECFAYLEHTLQEGMSEKDIAWEIESFIKQHAAELAFPPIVAFNEHSAIPHHVASPTTSLKTPTLVLLDFGAKTHGYHADITRVLFWGEPKKEWVNAYKSVKNAKDKATEYIQTTRDPSGKTADSIAREFLMKEGYESFPHGLGHGVGLSIHEDPRLSMTRDDVLKKDMVFTIEPAVYLPQQFGIRLEDTVWYTGDSLYPLTDAAYYSL